MCEGAYDGCSGGSLDAEEAVGFADFDDLHIIRNDKPVEAVHDLRGEAGLKIEEDFVLEAANVEVGLHFAFGGNKSGIAPGARGEGVDVIGDLAMEEARTVCADET